MAAYSRLLSWEARATDEVLALLINYSAERRVQGITVKELVRDYPNRLKDYRSVIAAVDLLSDEGRVLVERSSGHNHALDSIRIYPRVDQEVPPPPGSFDHREEHVEGEHRILIDFYKDVEGRDFVWPYIERVRQHSATAQHFQVRGHFLDQAAARDSALTQARTLISVGFEPS